MIVSFSKKFIFLKTRKTSGTSIEIVLSTFCENGDVCSFITSEDEEIRQEFGGLKPLERYKGNRIYNHMRARDIKEIFPEVWNNFFKFTIERHPYEKVISRVFWNIGRRNGDLDSEYDIEIENVIKNKSFIDRDIYNIDGVISVDEIIDYDSSWKRIEELAAIWNCDIPHKFPNAKSKYRKDKRRASEILNEDQKLRIRSVATFEFENFGYAP